MEQLQQEFKENLENLNKVELDIFLNKFKSIDGFKEREEYLKQEINQEILKILEKEEFQKLFYLDSQAKYVLNELKLDEKDFDILKTLIFCYNTNERNFRRKLELNNLEKDLFSRGFKKVDYIKEEANFKQLDGLKVTCVMDITKIGLMGSFDKKEELEGRLDCFTKKDGTIGLILIPKRSRTRGFIIRNNFYYKEVLK